jgi:hypothetical protein
MKRVFGFLGLSLAFASPALAAADFSGTWEVGVREFGGANYYLPVQDGRMVLEQQGAWLQWPLQPITFTGSVEKDGIWHATIKAVLAAPDLAAFRQSTDRQGRDDQLTRSLFR